MSTVSMQLNGKDSSTVSKSIDSCHSKEYTENISLTSLTLSTLGAEPNGTGENTRVWCACADIVNLWAWLPFCFASHFVSFLDLLAPPIGEQSPGNWSRAASYISLISRPGSKVSNKQLSLEWQQLDSICHAPRCLSWMGCNTTYIIHLYQWQQWSYTCHSPQPHQPYQPPPVCST